MPSRIAERRAVTHVPTLYSPSRVPQIRQNPAEQYYYALLVLDLSRRYRLRTAIPGRGRFVSVSIPEELIKEIDKILASHKGGYESRPEFIKEAVRKRLEEIKALSK